MALRFRTGKRYRHRNSLDIDLEIQKFLGENDDIVSFIVSYWNRKMKVYQGGLQVVSIRKVDLGNWKEIPCLISTK